MLEALLSKERHFQTAGFLVAPFDVKLDVVQPGLLVGILPG